MTTIRPTPGGAGSDDSSAKPQLLNVRNLMILAIAVYSTQSAVPAVVPEIPAGSVSSLLAFLMAVALLDRIIS